MIIRAVGSSKVQGELWSADPAGWAAGAESRLRPLYEAVLDRLGVTRGTRLLDAGCGSGLCVALADARGARAVGLDAAPALIELARKRTPTASFVVGDLEMLPFPDGAFDVVVACNSVLYAEDPRRAILEFGRVTAARGRVVVTAGTGAELATCGASIHPLLPPGVQASTRARLDLDDARQVRSAMRDGGLLVLERFEVEFALTFAGVEEAVRAQTPAGPVEAAARHSSPEAVEAALRGFFTPRVRGDGTVRVDIAYGCTVAERAGSISPA